MRTVKEIATDMKALKRDIAATEARFRKTTEKLKARLAELQKRGPALAVEYEQATAAQAKAFADSVKQ